MASLVVMSASLQCSFGSAPSTLIVTFPTVTGEKKPAANILDSIPMSNIPPFATCSSLANPTVASATAAASGVLTPMPCIPVTTPWTPGSPTVLLRKAPALNNTSKCMCSWAGVIQVTNPGTTKTTVA